MKFCKVKNFALGKPTYQSGTSQGGRSWKAVDGYRNLDHYEGSCMMTPEEGNPWWMVDLQDDVIVTSVVLSNRKYGTTLNKFEIKVHTAL